MWRHKTAEELARDRRRARWWRLNPFAPLAAALLGMLLAAPDALSGPAFAAVFALCYALQVAFGGRLVAAAMAFGTVGASQLFPVPSEAVCPRCQVLVLPTREGRCPQCASAVEARGDWTREALVPPSASPQPARTGRYFHRYPRPPRQVA